MSFNLGVVESVVGEVGEVSGHNREEGESRKGTGGYKEENRGREGSEQEDTRKRTGILMMHLNYENA